jgi:hypothetical protein
MPKRDPVIRKGATAPFKVAAVTWIDLLGYGEAIASAQFNPMHPNSVRMMHRLRTFHQVVARHSHRYFRSLTINDGAAISRDLSWRSASVTRDFVSRSWQLFREVQKAEFEAGEPGARLVLAVGFRVPGSKRGIDASFAHIRSIFRRLEADEITKEQAMREAAMHRPYSDVMPQLQANFAFTKAYLAEDSGSDGGLPGPNFYLDLALVAKANPTPSLQFGNLIDWSDNFQLGLSARFVPIIKIGNSPEGEADEDFRDGLSVAKALAPSNDVLSALQTMRLD